MYSNRITLATLFLLVFLTGCATEALSTPTPWLEKTFDFSDFQSFEMGVGYTSLYGSNPEPGLYRAIIRRTPDGKMRFSVWYYLPVVNKDPGNTTYWPYRIMEQFLIYPSRVLTDDEVQQVEMTFKQVTGEGWNEWKEVNCDPFSFFVYEWDGQDFSDVSCWRNTLTDETIAHIHTLMEDLTQGVPQLKLTPMPSGNTWR